ncbi:tigger transposable element-derived protein 4-like [Rhipicephalus sanguineus]|uniref:tigger transposable element-derived protein 4-like n=1 Tax=Rhipicephalus sanguineus TaxID=34632 RepID=UPI001893BAF1|nr:tigger transposable element-derived protein 4-like [Rhipicephalus sanguineus]
MMMEKADALALQMGHADFSCSNGWFERFKKRNNVSSKPIHGESGIVDEQTADAWRNLRLAELQKEYADKDIFNLDEATLFYKMLPNRTYTPKGEACSGAKQRKDGITILFGANATGDEKLPLLIIGKSLNPGCFRNARLPRDVTYRANKTAWMTAALFEEHVRALDRKMAKDGWKVLFVVDNCPGHGKIDNLAAVTLEFLPANVTSVLQPMDQGVIEMARKYYRKSLLHRILLSHDNAKKYEIDLLGAVNLMAEAWRQLRPLEIANCFAHAGFSRVPELIEDIGADFSGCDQLCNKVHKATGCVSDTEDGEIAFEEYALYEADVPVTGMLLDTDIVEMAVNDADDHAGEEEPREVPTTTETRNVLRLLRNKVECSGGDQRLMRCVEQLENAFLGSNGKQHEVFWSSIAVHHTVTPSTKEMTLLEWQH